MDEHEENSPVSGEQIASRPEMPRQTKGTNKAEGRLSDWATAKPNGGKEWVRHDACGCTPGGWGWCNNTDVPSLYGHAVGRTRPR